MKICIKCNKEKDFSSFYKEKKSKDGLRGSCKECIKKYSYDRKEIIKEYKKQYSINNEEYIRIKKKEYYLKNKERIKINRKEHYLKNKEKTLYKNKEYYLNNKDEVYKKRSEYWKNRLKDDLLLKIKMDMRNLILGSIRKGGYTKNSRTYKILGCSYNEFQKYIESKFEDWMNWENHGMVSEEYNKTWQYDHITPISSAANLEEIIKLNHYSNFQPLCSKKNLEKGKFLK